VRAQAGGGCADAGVGGRVGGERAASAGDLPALDHRERGRAAGERVDEGGHRVGLGVGARVVRVEGERGEVGLLPDLQAADVGVHAEGARAA
jgi:hypothetical protein